MLKGRIYLWTYANANTIKKAARFKIIKSRTEPLYFLCDFILGTIIFLE